MIEYIAAVFIVVAFVVLLKVLGLYEKSLKVVSISRSAASELADTNKNDEQKEQAIQAYARSLGGLFIKLAAGITVAILFPLGLVWLLDVAGLLMLDRVISIASRWEFLLAGLVLALLALLPSKRL